MLKPILIILLFTLTSTLNGHEPIHNNPAKSMVKAANNFISSLSDEEKNKAIFEMLTNEHIKKIKQHKTFRK